MFPEVASVFRRDGTFSDVEDGCRDMGCFHSCSTVLRVAGVFNGDESFRKNISEIMPLKGFFLVSLQMFYLLKC